MLGELDDDGLGMLGELDDDGLGMLGELGDDGLGMLGELDDDGLGMLGGVAGGVLGDWQPLIKIRPMSVSNARRMPGSKMKCQCC
jgi:hypothetical protein